MFYVYVLFGTYKYITINKKNLKIGITSDIKKAAYWTSKGKANTWSKKVKDKFASAELRNAQLTVLD